MAGADYWHPLVDGRALCASHPTVDFFPSAGGRGADTAAAEAQAICAECPIRAACAEWATYTEPQYFGVWGGLTQGRRRALRKAAGVPVGVSGGRRG